MLWTRRWIRQKRAQIKLIRAIWNLLHYPMLIRNWTWLIMNALANLWHTPINTFWNLVWCQNIAVFEWKKSHSRIFRAQKISWTSAKIIKTYNRLKLFNLHTYNIFLTLFIKDMYCRFISPCFVTYFCAKDRFSIRIS